MPEDEFERYLAQVAQALYLTDPQRAATVAELRDHLEHRLAELIAEGADRPRAIGTALAEFGEARAFARHLSKPHQPFRRRQLMQAFFVTTAAVGLVIAAVVMTGTGEPAVESSVAPSAGTQAAAPVQLRAVRHAQIDGDAFALNENLLFLAQSDTLIESGDGEPLPAFSAYGLNFSREVPRGVYRDRQANWLAHADPYRVIVPGARWASEVDPLLAEAAAQAEPGRLLYASLSSVYAPVVEGKFRVTVSLQDEAGDEIDRAELELSIDRSGLFNQRQPQRGHILQNHLLVFSAVGDADRIKNVEVEVVEEQVRVIEPRRAEAAGVAGGGQDHEAGQREIVLETERFTRQVEMAVLTDAIEDLNRSMDLHRRFLEKALADPDLAQSREVIRARWKMQSLQSLRGDLEGKLMSYMISC